jgi:D-sedoheptulose 7-phosphate isomerase
LKIKTNGFLRSREGLAKKMCDIKLVADSNETARIQEFHIFLGHFILGRVEEMLFFNKKARSRKR